MFGRWQNMRDHALEECLQEALDDGHDVWVVGDVHGFHQTMMCLVDVLDVGPNDWVVFLGDLIDRGPNSYGVVQAVRTTPNFATVQGNHETMMVAHFDPQQLRDQNSDLMLWMHNGGDATVQSYADAFRSQDGALDGKEMAVHVDGVREWMRNLPTHIVLDQWRLVHAGYRPGVAFGEQTDDDRLWIRGPFHHAQAPIDPQRTVVFGHTPTVALPGFTKQDWGRAWFSQVELTDGRSAAVGLDTCLYHKGVEAKHLTAMNLQTGEVVHQCRVEP